MKGSTHLLLSLLTGLVILAPLEELMHRSWPIAILLGIFFGSLAPDVDNGCGSAIFHSAIPGAKGRLFFLTPVIGYTLYFLCYKPLSIIFVGIFGQKILPKKGHRELPHSPVGIICISALLTLWIWLLCYTLSCLPSLSFLRNNLLIWIFGAAFLLGCVLHLLEDTCDNSGIHYLYPFQFHRVRGTVAGDGFDIRPKMFGATMVVAAIALFSEFSTGRIASSYAVWAAFLVPAALWGIFLKISGVPAKKATWE
ncbi:MAG: metal-dependent hydrolase [Methanocalculaceae archaeon]|nr:metal-dependent hydrolase [Methanocalculaceae archaeon]